MRYTSAQSGLVPQISKATTQGPSTSLFCLFYTLQDSSYSFFLFILQWIHSCLYQLSSRRSYHGAVQQGQRSGKVPEIHIGGWASHHNFPPSTVILELLTNRTFTSPKLSERDIVAAHKPKIKEEGQK